MCAVSGRCHWPGGRQAGRSAVHPHQGGRRTCVPVQEVGRQAGWLAGCRHPIREALLAGKQASQLCKPVMEASKQAGRPGVQPPLKVAVKLAVGTTGREATGWPCDFDKEAGMQTDKPPQGGSQVGLGHHWKGGYRLAMRRCQGGRQAGRPAERPAQGGSHVSWLWSPGQGGTTGKEVAVCARSDRSDPVKETVRPAVGALRSQSFELPN